MRYIFTMLDSILMVDQGTSPREILPAGFDLSAFKGFDFGNMEAPPIAAEEIHGRVGIVSVTGRLSRSPSLARLMGWSEQATTDELADAIHRLAANDAVDSIVLRVNSGGGEIDGIRNVVEAITEAKGRKKVTASVDGRAGSAAYWIAAQADRVVASSGSLVGAIGAFAVLEDVTEAMENAGIKRFLVSSGGVKGLGADGKVTPEMEAEYQRIVLALADQAVTDISASRKTSKAIVSSKWATGQMWTAEEGVALGLVDQIQSTRGLLRSFARSNDARGGITTMSMSKEDPKVEAGAARPEGTPDVSHQLAALTEGLSSLVTEFKSDREDRLAAQKAAEEAKAEQKLESRAKNMTKLLDAAVAQGRIDGAQREMFKGLLATAEDDAIAAFAQQIFVGQPLLAAGFETPPSESVAASIGASPLGLTAERPSEARLKAVSHPHGTVLNPARHQLAEIGRAAARKVKAEGGDREACANAHRKAIYAASGQRMAGTMGGVGADPWDQ